MSDALPTGAQGTDPPGATTSTPPRWAAWPITRLGSRVESLNADKLDGLEAADLGPSWAVVSATGPLSRDDGAARA